MKLLNNENKRTECMKYRKKKKEKRKMQAKMKKA